MVFTLFAIPILILLVFLILIGHQMLMIADQLVDLLCFLALILFHGLPRNNRWFPVPVLKLNTVALLT